MELCFRAATKDDTDAIVALVTSAYRGDSSRVGWTTEADLIDGNRIDAETLRGYIARPQSCVLLAERANDGGSLELLGCAHVCIEDHAGYFGMFSIRPDLQGAGLGKRLLAQGERVARDDWKLPAMRMTVIDVRDELIDYYVRRGYRRTGIKKPFPATDPRFGIPKRDDLRFEVLEKAL